MVKKKDDEEKKNIFEKIGDALSSRDEKEAEEAAKKAAEEAAEAARKKESEERIAAAKEQIRLQREASEAKIKAEKDRKMAEEAAKKLADEKLARQKAEEAQARLRAQAPQPKPIARPDVGGREIAAAKPAAAPVPVLAKYTIKDGDTLSGIAQKHYGHSTRDYWMVIYEANKAVIGDNPGMIKPGAELTIPVLPPSLEGK